MVAPFAFWGELACFGEGGRMFARVREAQRRGREEKKLVSFLTWKLSALCGQNLICFLELLNVHSCGGKCRWWRRRCARWRLLPPASCPFLAFPNTGQQLTESSVSVFVLCSVHGCTQHQQYWLYALLITWLIFFPPLNLDLTSFNRHIS